MKKTKFWIIILIVVAMPMLNACGGGDDGPSGGGSSSELVDGVNVNKRKLLTLDVSCKDNKLGSFQMTYDAKGRLTRIDANTVYFISTYIVPVQNDGTSTSYEVRRASEKTCALLIDYDLGLIEYLDGYKGRYDSQTKTYVREPVYVKSRFALNDRGFVSQIANCECTYNSEGYLTGVKTIGDFWSLVYNNGDVVKAMVEKFKNGNIGLYYVYYGDKTNEGELYVTCKELDFGSGDKFTRSEMTMIAYHAGLFGNITKHCTMLPNSADAKTFLELADKSYWVSQNETSKKITEEVVLACKFTFSD